MGSRISIAFGVGEGEGARMLLTTAPGKSTQMQYEETENHLKKASVLLFMG